MSGPAPKLERRRRNVPVRGDWTPAPGSGWQHGPVPAPPDGLLKKSREAWDTWFASWTAGHWNPEFLPQVYVTIRLFDAVERGDYAKVTELRQWMDGIGVTFRGQQDRRWLPPKEEAPAVTASGLRRLRVVGE